MVEVSSGGIEILYTDIFLVRDLHFKPFTKVLRNNIKGF